MQSDAATDLAATLSRVINNAPDMARQQAQLIVVTMLRELAELTGYPRTVRAVTSEDLIRAAFKIATELESKIKHVDAGIVPR